MNYKKHGGIDPALEKQFRRYMSLHAESVDNPTELAEMCAEASDHEEWLDDDDNPVLEWARKLFEEE